MIIIEWKRNTKRLPDFNLVEIYKYLVELWAIEVGDDAWSNRARARQHLYPNLTRLFLSATFLWQHFTVAGIPPMYPE